MQNNEHIGFCQVKQKTKPIAQCLLVSEPKILSVWWIINRLNFLWKRISHYSLYRENIYLQCCSTLFKMISKKWYLKDVYIGLCLYLSCLQACQLSEHRQVRGDWPVGERWAGSRLRYEIHKLRQKTEKATPAYGRYKFYSWSETSRSI